MNSFSTEFGNYPSDLYLLQKKEYIIGKIYYAIENIKLYLFLRFFNDCYRKGQKVESISQEKWMASFSS